MSTAHEKRRAKVAADLADFRRRGGVIEHVPTGLSGDPWNAQVNRGAHAINIINSRRTRAVADRKEAARKAAARRRRDGLRESHLPEPTASPTAPTA